MIIVPRYRRCAPSTSREPAIRAPLIAAMLMLATSLPAPALAQHGDWRGALKQQLQSQYGCRLERFVFEREVPLGRDNAREGRVQCADGREVDYAQPNILLKFELRLCAPTVC